MSGVAETILSNAGAQPPVSSTPPIVEIFQILYRLAGLGLTSLWTATTYLYLALRTASFPVTTIVSTVYAPLSYILAPFVLSVTILANAFVVTPYGMLKSALHDIYPLYAFLVVSLIYAGGIGLCARTLCRVGMSALAKPTDGNVVTESKKTSTS
ncbi:hypothetical protein BDY19DRAFT_760589 [Irpex rosettiformis]|uniref:Uncharacterized protein n=1 Tax=Irpex rosettiformis TaxID=378272 RepID=A0ACB8U7N6_9APHY|nr:hypothetical protein BDY19DRAFT_760589 [Irpex rosettiformis]